MRRRRHISKRVSSSRASDVNKRQSRQYSQAVRRRRAWGWSGWRRRWACINCGFRWWCRACLRRDYIEREYFWTECFWTECFWREYFGWECPNDWFRERARRWAESWRRWIISRRRCASGRFIRGVGGSGHNECCLCGGRRACRWWACGR